MLGVGAFEAQLIVSPSFLRANFAMMECSEVRQLPWCSDALTPQAHINLPPTGVGCPR
jgi:hypothetical protein